MQRMRSRGPATVLALTGAAQAVLNAAAALLATVLLGAADRGLIVLAVTISSIVGLLAGLGTDTALRTLLPGRSGTDRQALVASYTWCSSAGALMAAAGAALAVWCSASILDPALRSGPFLVASGGWAFALVLLTRITEAWFADGEFGRGGRAGAAMATGGLVGVLAALSITRSPAWVLLAQALGLLVVGLPQLRSLYRVGLLSWHRPNRADSAALLRLGAAQLGLVVGLAIALRADRYLLGVVAGPAVVGVYALAATLSELPRMVPLAQAQVYFREVALGRGRERLARTGAVAVAAAAVCGLLAGICGWLLIVPLFGDEFADARVLLIILLVAETTLAPYLIASRGLLGGGWARTVGLLGLGGSVAAIASYAVGATVATDVGVALACVCTYLSLSLVAWSLLRRRLPAASLPGAELVAPLAAAPCLPRPAAPVIAGAQRSESSR